MPNHDSVSYIQLRSGTISPLVGTYFLYVAGSFASLLLNIPLMRLFERSICNRHYQASVPKKDVDESLCKVAPVQDELAAVLGWQLSFNALAGKPLLGLDPMGDVNADALARSAHSCVLWETR